MSPSEVIAARTPLEAHLYLDVHGVRGPRAEQRAGTQLRVQAHDAQGQAQRYTFELSEPNGEGFGAGPSVCLEALELWEHAEALASTVPAAPERMSDAQYEQLQRVLAIAEQVLRLYAPGQTLPNARSAHAQKALAERPLRMRRERIEASLQTWQRVLDAAKSVRAGRATTQALDPVAEERAIEDRFESDYVLYTTMRSQPLLARLLLRRGRAYESAQSYDKAAADFAGAVQLFLALGDVCGEAAALVHIARLCAARGDLRGAQTNYDRALQTYGSVHDAHGEADALWGRGALWSLGRDQEQCTSDLFAALERYHALGSKDGIASVLFERARLRSKQGRDPGGADADYRQAARLFGELGDTRQAEVLRAQRMAAGGSTDSALDPRERAEGLKARARQRRNSGDLRAALADTNEALGLFEQLHEPIARANTLADRAKLHHALGDLAAAGVDLDAALALYDQQGSQLGRANIFEARGDLARQQHDLARANADYQRALTLYERLGVPSGRANTHGELARLALAQQDLAAAREHAERARELGRGGVSDYASEAASEVLAALGASQAH